MQMNPDQLRREYPFVNDPTVPFSCREELMAAMASPKYGNDPSYTAVIEARVLAGGTGALGVADHRKPIMHTFVGPSNMSDDNLDLLPGARRYQAPDRTEAALPFVSREEFLSAVSDPRYKTDDAYRAECGDRLSVSPPEVRR